jgi:hypothetical protein
MDYETKESDSFVPEDQRIEYWRDFALPQWHGLCWSISCEIYRFRAELRSIEPLAREPKKHASDAATRPVAARWYGSRQSLEERTATAHG